MTAYNYMPPFVFIFFALLAFTSCRKSPNPQEGHTKLDREGLKYIQIPLNKYFIYKDSASGNLDSVVVTQSNLEEVHVAANNTGVAFDYNSHPGYYVEKYELTLTQFNGNNASAWSTAKTTTTLVSYDIDLNNSPVALYDINDTTKANIFVYPAGTNILPTLTIEGKVYNDIIVAASFGKLVVYYWAKNVGIIKRRVMAGSVLKTSTLVRNG